jgi:NUDIX domain
MENRELMPAAHNDRALTASEFFSRAQERLTFDVPAGFADPTVIPRHDQQDADPAVVAAIAAVRPIRLAAVLVPIIERDEPSVLFTQRTAHLTDHAGQISFPGGKIDASDQSPAAAALREAEEVEIAACRCPLSGVKRTHALQKHSPRMIPSVIIELASRREIVAPSILGGIHYWYAQSSFLKARADCLAVSISAWKSFLKCHQNGQPVRHFPEHWVLIHLPTHHFYYLSTGNRRRVIRRAKEWLLLSIKQN